MKQRFPKRGEFLIAIVRRILPYGAFCVLPEYDDLEAFLHVSEVAPRWIKNIHEFLHEKQHLVVKVIRADEKKHQVDVSVKRVSDEEKRNKLEQVRREKRAKKMIEFAIKKAKSRADPENIYAAIEQKYGEDVFGLFEEVLDDDTLLDKVKMPDKVRDELVALIKSSIKKPIVEVSADVVLKCYGADGINTIKKAFGKIKDKCEILYLGAPNYRVRLKAEDYKEGNREMEKLLKKVQKALGKHCEMEWQIIRVGR